MHDLVKVWDATWAVHIRPVEQREVDDDRQKEQRASAGAAATQTHGARNHARAGTAGCCPSELRTACVTAAATAPATSGWKTLGTM